MRYLFQMVAFLAVLWMHAKMAATKAGFFSDLGKLIAFLVAFK